MTLAVIIISIMNIFVSWSGERSHQVAKLLNTWIQCVLQSVNPWLSSKDIDKGSLWFTEINNQLSTCQNGIICLTKSNLSKPWILFEAGALAKGLSSNRVYTFLIDLNPSEIKDPLAQFNHTTPSEIDMYHLITTINNNLEPHSLKENILANVFRMYWPQFELEFSKIMEATKNENMNESRSSDDILNEILYSVRNLDKRTRNLENIDKTNETIPSDNVSYQKPFVLDIPIENLGLLRKTRTELRSLGINTLKELLSITKEKISSLSPMSQLNISSFIEI
jgi:hypothetical protein